jgi:hypothetical protein
MLPFSPGITSITETAKGHRATAPFHTSLELLGERRARAPPPHRLTAAWPDLAPTLPPLMELQLATVEERERERESKSTGLAAVPATLHYSSSSSRPTMPPWSSSRPPSWTSPPSTRRPGPRFCTDEGHLCATCRRGRRREVKLRLWVLHHADVLEISSTTELRIELRGGKLEVEGRLRLLRPRILWPTADCT